MEQKVDLHLHTKHSDGRQSVEELLDICEDAELDIISITDHDCVDAYGVLKDEKVRQRFSGRIIPGVEISTVYEGVLVHVLGYGIDVDKITLSMRHISSEDTVAFRKREIETKFKEWGINFESTAPQTVEQIREIVTFFEENPNELSKIPEKIDLSPRGGKTSIGVLFWNYINNRNSCMFIDFGKLYSSFDEAIEIIHMADGKAVLAHPAQYLEFSDIVLDYAKDKVDGVEVYHYSANEDWRDKLLKYAELNNLFVTGGSDYHGGLNCRINRQGVEKSMVIKFLSYF